MRRLLAIATLAAGLALAPAVPAGAATTFAPQTTLYGLTTDNRILTFSSRLAVVPTNVVRVTGLQPGEQLIGIDRRPKTGEIYGVGKLGTTGRLYTVDPRTGVATFVATLVSAPTATSAGGTPIVLSGTEFGFDFNPAADALRITSDTGQNLRVIPSNRAPAGAPALRTGDTFTDGALNVAGAPATGVSAAGYTNSATSATQPATTTLYDIDTARDLLVRQNPPNAGGLETVGPLGFPAGTRSGFDIVSTPSGEFAFAALTVESAFPLTVLFQVDLTTGRAVPIGVVSPGSTLRGITA